jgi:hypothetical protein
VAFGGINGCDQLKGIETPAHIVLCNIDQAIESLAKSLDEGEPFSTFLKLDPEFDPLRGDPRFCELVSRLGL